MITPSLKLNELLKNRLRIHGEKVALHFGEKAVKYNDILRSANRVANALRANGVVRNTRVAMLLSNREEFVITDIGIYFSGGTKVALNTMLGEQDIKYILQDSEAEILFVEEKFLEIIKKIKEDLPHLRIIVSLDAASEESGFVTWDDFLQDHPETDVEDISEENDMSFILYTGGTTGKPKGVVHTREGTCLTMLSIAMDANIYSDDRLLLTTPLPHASMLYLYGGMLMGAEIFIEDKFDLEVVVQHIEKNKKELSFMPLPHQKVLAFYCPIA